MTRKINDCTIIVSSCDNYSDLWEPYFTLLRKHWPDCPFEVALITAKKEPKIGGVKALCQGEDLNWSSNLLAALKSAKTPFVLLTLEDFFIRHQVDNKLIVNLFDQMKANDLNMLRLTPRPGPNKRLDDRPYGAIFNEAPYKVSTQAAFWRTSILEELLVPGESAWEFESRGSLRARDLPGFVAVWKPALPYIHHVVERGKWFSWDYKKFRKLNIGVKENSRPVMNFKESINWIFKKVVARTLAFFPKSVSKALKRAI